MEFALNDEQKMMIDTVRRFIKEELKPLEDEIEDSGTPDPVKAAATHAKAKSLGLYALNIPGALGGGGLSTVDRILCEEQFGHTSDILIRRAFGNVYEPLLVCQGAQVDAGLDARDWIAMVKVHAAETLGRVVDRGVQVFGGMGVCKELPIERYYRDARIYRIFDGTSEIHRSVIAKTVLKRGAALFDVHR